MNNNVYTIAVDVRQPPQLTVVTVCKDDIAGLTATIQSVESQSIASRIQHVIIDGASKDSTPSLLEPWGQQMNRNYISEPDTGIYDAMNKGLALAEAPLIWFINAGDVFADPESADEGANAIVSSGANWMFGAVIPVDTCGERAGPTLMPSFSRRRMKWGDVYLNQQALIMRTDFLRSIGGFDSGFVSAGEFEMYLRAMRVDDPTCFHRELVLFKIGGASYTGVDTHFKEMKLARNMHLKPTAIQVMYNTIITIYRLCRNRIGRNGGAVLRPMRDMYLQYRYREMER